jgi:hypothetical protein
VLPEDVEFFLEDEVVQLIPFLKNHFADDNSSNSVKINNITGQIFSHIITHIRSHNINPDDHEFTNRMLKNLSIDELFDLVLASNSLGVTSLVDEARTRFMTVTSSGDPDKVRQIFKIKYDFDEEDSKSNGSDDIDYGWKELS